MQVGLRGCISNSWEMPTYRRRWCLVFHRRIGVVEVHPCSFAVKSSLGQFHANIMGCHISLMNTLALYQNCSNIRFRLIKERHILGRGVISKNLFFE